MPIKGLWGRPFLDLTTLVDCAPLAEIHDEVCLALSRLPVRYTGGSHRSMGIMPPGQEHTSHGDYGEALRGMTDAQWRTFCELSDGELDPSTPRTAVGEEKEVPLSWAQMRWLNHRFGVYFPWKVFYPLMDVQYWEEKAQPRAFTREARAFFPALVRWVKALPFTHVGRCNIMGLEANDHGTLHRDGDPAAQVEPDHFITFCPAGNKRLYLWDDATGARVPATGRAYWFNDFDWHGVEADPFFRYSVRVDGVFRADFLERVRALAGGGAA